MNSITGQTATRIFFISLLGAVILRGLFNSVIPLSGEEAYYWMWSRYPDLCYFDHPPLIAWMIRIATTLFGHSVFAVRFSALLSNTLTACPYSGAPGASPETAWLLHGRGDSSWLRSFLQPWRPLPYRTLTYFSEIDARGGAALFRVELLEDLLCNAARRAPRGQERHRHDEVGVLEGLGLLEDRPQGGLALTDLLLAPRIQVLALGGGLDGFDSPYLGHTGSWDGKGGAFAAGSKAAAMDEERAMGLRWTFMPVHWRALEPDGPVDLARETPPAWQALDAFVIAAKERKLNVLMQAPVVGGNAGGPPKWAGRREEGKAKTQDLSAQIL